MPIIIQTGGAGAQLGAGLGAGFSKGVTDAMEQQREDELLQKKRAYEKELQQESHRLGLERQAAAHGQAMERQDAAAQDRVGALMVEEQIKKGAQQREWDREDDLAFDARMRDSAAASNLAIGRIDGLRDSLGEESGGADPRRARKVQLLDEVELRIANSTGAAETAGHLADLDEAWASLQEEEDLQDAVNFAAVLEAEGDMDTAALLQGAIKTGNVMQAQAIMADKYARIEAENKQQASLAKAMEFVEQARAAYAERQMPSHITTEDGQDRYAKWSAEQDARIVSTIAMHNLAATVQGLSYSPLSMVDAVKAITEEIDPETVRIVQEQLQQAELERVRAEERIKAQERGRQDIATDPNLPYADERRERYAELGAQGPEASIFDEVRGLTEKQVSDLAAEALAAGDDNRFDALSNILMAMEQAQE